MSDVPREAGRLYLLDLEGDSIVATYEDENLEAHTAQLDARTGALIAIEADEL